MEEKSPTVVVKYQTYTPESMKSYLDALAIVKYEGWKREEGLIKESGLPWISFEHPSGTWMNYWCLTEEERLVKHEFNPNTLINLTVND